MKYELIKKLKDAGLTWDDDRPSLSELIEACGKIFLFWSPEDKTWVAGDRGLEGEEYIPDILMHDWNTRGSTPSEAVANLWLELKTPN